MEGIHEAKEEREIELKLELIQNGQTVKSSSIKVTVGPVLTDLKGVRNGGQAGLVTANQPLLYQTHGLNMGNDLPVLLQAKAIAGGLSGALRLTVTVRFQNNLANGVGALVGAAQVQKKYDFRGADAGKTFLDGNDPAGPFYTARENQQPGWERTTTAKDNPRLWLNAPAPGQAQQLTYGSILAIPPGNQNSSTYDVSFRYTVYADWHFPSVGNDRSKDIVYFIGSAAYAVRYAGVLGWNNNVPMLTLNNNDGIIDSNGFSRSNDAPAAIAPPNANDVPFGW